MPSVDKLSDRVCRFIANSRYEDLPATTIAAAKRALLDATGVIYAASGHGTRDLIIRCAEGSAPTQRR